MKSVRFFERAINVYNEGLDKFPMSFDLAYNKARVQYEVATHPKLAKQLKHPLVDALKLALASHECALKLDENDADLLFNTSQVLTSIAEELANNGSAEEAITLLQSALKLQARCFSVQEQMYAETLRRERDAQEIFDTEPNDNLADGEILADEQSDIHPAKDNDDEGQWASVVEPITANTLTDTIIACFGTMTTLCTTIIAPAASSWKEVTTDIESQYMQFVSKIQGLSLVDPEKMHEVSLADAILQSAMLDAAFMFNDLLSAATYKSMLDNLWSASKPHLDLEIHADALIAHANALIAFNYSLATNHIPDASNMDVKAELDNFRWAVLTSAIKSLTTASKIPSISPDEKAKTHLLRGDASLLQYRMSTYPIMHKQAAAHAETLFKNAQVFYRNAAQLSSDQEDKEHALFRCGVMQNIADGNATRGRPALSAIFEIDRERRAAEELQDMLDEGFLPERMDPGGLVSYT